MKNYIKPFVEEEIICNEDEICNNIATSGDEEGKNEEDYSFPKMFSL